MVLRKNMIRGMFVIIIYFIITCFLFMAADRIERLEREDRNILIEDNLKINK